MLFELKNVIEALCQPLTVGMELAIFGFILFRTRRCARIGRYMIPLGLLVILLFGYSLVPRILQKSLAGRYPPMTTEMLREMSGRTGDRVWIVVLCGGYTTNWPSSVGAQLSEASLFRFVEGVRVYRQMPNGKVLLSVGGLPEGMIQKRLGDQLAETVGLPRRDLQTVGGAMTTQDEARQISANVGTTSFVLVTSDYHMPRAMMLFKALGMNPVPAPAGTCGWSEGESRFSLGGLFPKGANLDAADGALHEYLGILWANLQCSLKTRPARVVSSPGQR